MADDSSADPRIRRIVRSPATLQRPVTGGVASLFKGDQSVEAAVLVELESDAIPSGFAHYRWHKIADGFYLTALPIAELSRLESHPDVLLVEVGKDLTPDLIESRGDVHAPPMPPSTSREPGCDGRGVVVGIIDQGFDFTLDDFRDEAGNTRVAYLWDQSLLPTADERSPLEFQFGVEYDRAAIDRALKAQDPFTVVRHKPKPQSHGTHVAGIAAGNGRSFDNEFKRGAYVGVAPAATIIFVQTGAPQGLSPSVDSYRTNFNNTVASAAAASYIFEKARQLDMPCVINSSSSLQNGGRDGESVYEHLLDSMLRRRGRAFVTTTGNVGANQAHASGRLTRGEVRRLPLAVELTMSSNKVALIQFWHRSVDRLRLRLVNPAGRATPWISPNEEFTEADDGSGNKTTIDYESFTAMNGESSIIIELVPVGDGDVTTGTWHFELEATDIVDGRFDAWVDNARKAFCAFPSGHFDVEKSIAAPATAYSTIAVGLYDNRQQDPPGIHIESSRGPTRDNRQKPDIVAPGVAIVSSSALGGLQPDGSHAPVRHAGSGTSQAAPHVAGAVALMLQKARGLSTPQIRELLIAGATRAPDAPLFRPDWGHGLLNIERTLALIDEMVPQSTAAVAPPTELSTPPPLADAASSTPVAVGDIANQEFVELCAGIPIFRLQDGRYHLVSNFAVADLETARAAAIRLARAWS